MAYGIFTLNVDLNNSLVFADIYLIKNLFDVDPKNVGSIDIYQNTISVEKVASFFGPQFLTENRVQQNGTIYKMLNTEQLAIYLIFSLIVVVALFNMFGALMMMVIEKKDNLHTLLVLGLTKRGE